MKCKSMIKCDGKTYKIGDEYKGRFEDKFYKEGLLVRSSKTKEPDNENNSDDLDDTQKNIMDYTSMNVAELRECADDLELEHEGMKKAELIELLEEQK